MASGTPQRFSQDEWEFSQFLLHAAKARSYLEIGCRYGECLRLVANAMEEGGRMVAVDLPNDPWSPNHHVEIAQARSDALVQCRARHDATIYLGDSQDPGIISAVRRCSPFDLAFIDGDHTYAGVRADWIAYGPMAEVVAFHDINNAEWGVQRLWRELKPHFVTAEYIRGDWGIGMIWRKVKRL